MADNAAQAIKELRKNLDAADNKLKDILSDHSKYESMISNAFKSAAQNAKMSVDDLIAYIGQKTKQVNAEKLNLQVNFKRKDIEDAVSFLNQELKKHSNQVNIFGKSIEGAERIKALVRELKSYLSKSPNALYDDVIKMVNSSAASGRGGHKGTPYAQQQAKNFAEINRLSDDIIKKSQRRLELEQKIGKLKEGSKKWKETKKDLDDANRLLSQYAGKLYTLGGRGQSAVKGFLASETLRDSDINIRKTNQELDGLKNKTMSMLPILQRLGYAFGVAFSVRGLVQFGKKLVEIRGEFELQQVALRSILQNRQLADEIWDKTMKAALQSPFTAMQLTKYTKQLAAYRIETEKLFDTTKMLADVSAGLGVDMQRLILAYGQVKAANYLRASEIRQFTEAGVNILGELSQYFTETRGEMISTAQVMDMVQKRMVRFQDVEAIFQRMTQAGGIFYNMQYVQSQTVKGQIAKLHDAYDQMLNSMGQANQGTLRDMIAALNNIVRNWRTWAAVIKSIGFGTLIALLSRTAVSLMGIEVAGIAAGAATSKLTVSVKALGKALKANWLTLIIGAVVSLAAELVNLAKTFDAVNKEIDEQNFKLYETRQNFEDLKGKIEANNAIIKDVDSNTENLTKAQNDNMSIMQKLRNEYPQMAEQMSIATNGIIDMNGAIDKNIRKLEEQMTIINAMKATSIFSDTDQKNLTDYEQDLAKLQVQMAAVQSKAKMFMMEMQLEGADEAYLYDIYKQIAEIDLSGNILDAVAAFEKLERSLPTDKIVELNDDLKMWVKPSSSEYKKFKLNPREYYPLSVQMGFMPGDRDYSGDQDRAEKALDNVQAALKRYYENGIMDNAEYFKEINERYNGSVTDFINANADRLNEDTKKGVNKANEILIKTLNPQTKEMKDYLNRYFNQIWGFTNPVDLFATPIKNINTEVEDPEEKQAKIDAAWRRRIQLLEEMKKRYDELSKSAYGYQKSEDTVRSEFQKSWKKEFGNMLSMDAIDFTSAAAMQQAFERFITLATNAGEAVQEELQKKGDSYGARIPIDVEVRSREDFAREIEQMFSDYELTLNLQKINLPSDVAKDFIGLDYTSIMDVWRKLTTWRDGRMESGLYSEADMKLYETWMKKVTDKVYAMRKEKAKEYTKYLEQELSERAKLTMQYTTDVAFVKANVKNGSQKDMILQNLEENYTNAINELKWKSFKESSFYVEMMQDLTSMPSEYLNMMMEKLNEWVEKADVLSPKALKEVLRAREKIIEAQVAMSPIRALGVSIAGMEEFQTSGRTDVNGQDISRFYKESRRQLEGIIIERERAIEKAREELEIQEALLGYLTAQENIERTISELSASGVGGLNAASSIEQITQELTQWQNLLNGKTEPTQAAGESGEDFQKRLQQYDQEKIAIQNIIDLLILLQSQRQEADQMATTATAMGIDLSQSPSKTGTFKNVSNLKKELNKLDKEQAKDQQKLVYFKQYNKAVHGLAQNIATVTGKVKGVNGAIYNMMDALGETDEITDLWKSFGDAMVDSITNVLNLIPALITGYTAAGVAINSAMGIIGLIAEAIQLTITLITFLTQLSDAQKDKEIDALQDKIDALKDAYERLEKAIEKTWDTVSYMSNYNQMVDNLKQQIEALKKQRDAEQSKKKSDEDKIKDYNDAIQDAEDKIEELRQKYIEVFGGIGEINYRSAAQEFVDAWKEAFLETGDGLEGLKNHFDEFLQEWFVKQATMRIAGKMLQPLFEQIDRAVDQYNTGGTTVLLGELNAVKEKFSTIAPQLSEALEQLAGMWGLGDGEGGLSGLAAGIQGMSEEQANILEAYWNSVRMCTASIDMNVARIVDILGAGTGDRTNPQLQQLEIIARNTTAINSLFDSVVTGAHTKGGKGIKVFMN